MKPKKKFKETVVGRFLLGNGGKAILETVGDVIPGANIVRTLIEGDKAMDEDKKEIALIMLEAERHEFDGITERWKADAASDNKLSKLVRPSICIACFCFMVVFTLMDSFDFGFNIKDAWIDFWQLVCITVFGAYFGSKGFERIADKRTMRQ